MVFFFLWSPMQRAIGVLWVPTVLDQRLAFSKQKRDYPTKIISFPAKCFKTFYYLFRLITSSVRKTWLAIILKFVIAAL